MDKVNVFFNSLSDLYSLVEVITAFNELVTAHTELDRESGTYSLSYCCEDFLSEAHTVFYRTAVLVSSVVEER